MTRRRTAQRAIAVTLGSGAVLLVLAGSASAHHAEVVAAADCTGTVTFSVAAWAGVPNTAATPTANDLSRTVPRVALEISTDGGPFIQVVDHLQLGPTNAYASTGSFPLPAGPLPRSLVVRTVSIAPFADGATGGDQPTPALDLSRCHGQRSDPTATTPSAAAPARTDPAGTPPGPTAGTASASASPGSAGVPDREAILLGGGLLGSLGAWRLSRPRQGTL